MVKNILLMMIALTALFGAPAHAQTLAAGPDTYTIILDEGDSISAASYPDHADQYQIARPNAAVIKRAVGGSGLTQLNSRLAYDVTLKPRFVTLLIGGNDAETSGTWLANLWTYTDYWRSLGVKVAVGTLLPQCSTYSATFNTTRNTLNPLIRAGEGVHYDKLIDYAADSIMGLDATGCDTTYIGDGIHPTAAGQTRLAAVYTAAVDSMVALAGPGDGYVAQPATYAAGSSVNTIGDGSTAKGGTALAFIRFPETRQNTTTPLNLGTALPSGYIVGGGGGCALASPTVYPCIEKKVRFAAESIGFRYDDPIRLYGQPGGSHCHEFFGYLYPSAFATRASISVRIGSAASGGPANNTIYWEPCWKKTIGGSQYAMPSIVNIIYYSVGVPAGQAVVDNLQPLHTRLRFITGTNMDDPDDAVVKAEIATANAQPGTAGRYSYRGNGFLGYQCNTNGLNGTTIAVVNGAGAGTDFSPYFVTGTGADPWGGNCLDGYSLVAVADAPECWDGFNITSPTGYRHFRHLIGDSVLGGACPLNWFRLPTFEIKTAHQSHGWADYSTWSLDSDAMMAAKLTALGTPRAVQPGESFHNDWFDGWNQSILNGWLDKCLGIGSNAPHTCDTNTIDPTTGDSLLAAGPSPDGERSPQVNISKTLDTNDTSVLTKIGTARNPTHDMRGM